MPATAPAYLHLGDLRLEAEGGGRGRSHVGARPGSGGRSLRTSCSSGCAAPMPRSAPTAASSISASASSQPTRRTGVRGSHWRANGRAPASRPTRSNFSSKRSRRILTPSWCTRRSGRRWRQYRMPAATDHAVSRAHARGGLLPGSPPVHAVPLPQHRAALALSAVPRVEHVHRGADDVCPR